MKIAVVIPVFNGEQWIRQTLESVLNQSFSSVEVVVVDDGSIDSSRAIVREYPQVQLLSSPGSGPNVARNHGWQQLNTDAVALLDCDDLWHPDHLQRLADILHQRKDCVAAFSKIVPFSSDAEPTYQAAPSSFQTYNPWVDFPINRLGQPVGALIRRNALAAIGGLSTRHDGCADYQLWIRLALEGPLIRANWKTAAYRVHPVSYNHSLRASQTQVYFARRYDASREALEERSRRGLDGHRYAKRLAALYALLDVFEAIQADETDEIHFALEQFDNALHEEPSAIFPDLWELFGWYTEPYFTNVENRSFVDLTFQLLKSWPRGAPRSHALICKWACQQSSPRDLVQRWVWNMRSWMYLVQHILAERIQSARTKLAIRTRLQAVRRSFV
jgi:glycosyltransferase involved in cell wall biosynthesis